MSSILKQWPEFEKWAAKQPENTAYKDENGSFDFVNYYKGATINEDAAKYKFVV